MITKLFICKNRFFFSIVYILVFSILLMSCETVTNQRYSPETIKSHETQISNATHIVLKDGTFVSLKGKQVYYFEKYKEFDKAIVIKDGEGIPYRDTVKNVTYIKYSEKVYPLDSIKELYVEKREFDAGNTVLLVIGSLAAAALAFFIVALISFSVSMSSSSHRCCPYIFSYNGSDYILDGEPLGGAVCEGLERTDVSRLENLVNSDGKLKLIVKNINEEQQRIDELKFFNIKHSKGEFIAPDYNRKFYKYSESVKPFSAINEQGKDITKFLLENDNVRWLNDLPTDTLLRNYSSKETITLKFPKPKNAKNAMLLINGGASYFGSNMIKELLDLKGDKVDDWYKSIYPGSDEQKKLFDVMHRDETYYMDIKIAEGNTLRNTGIMKSNGPMIDEDVLYPVSLENHNSDFVEIVLTPQRYFWKFDKINIVYDYQEVSKDDVETLSIAYAKDNYGNDVREKLSASDKDYYRMPNVGDKVELYLNTPENFSKETNDIFVATTGWYEINLEKNTKPNETLITEILSKEGGLLNYAMGLYISSFKSISQIYNQRKVYEN
jgi:hypothetical protein